MIEMPLDFVAEVSFLRGAGLCQVEGILQYAIDTGTAHHRFLNDDFHARCLHTSCRRRSSTRPSVFFAHDVKKSMSPGFCGPLAGLFDAGASIGRGRRVDVLVELATKTAAASPHSEIWSGTLSGQPTAP